MDHRNTVLTLGRDPFVAQRVRALRIPSRLFLPWIPEKRGIVERVAGAAKHVWTRGAGRQKPQELTFETTSEATNAMAGLFGGISELQELHLYHQTYFEGSIPLMSTSWNAFGAHLRSLSLYGTLETVSDALWPPVAFAELEQLTIHLDRSCSIMKLNRVDRMSRNLAYFTNSHKATLQCFGLIYQSELDLQSNVSLLLDGLGHFPALREFSLSAPLNGPGQIALRKILDAHRKQLSVLVITHALPATFWSEPQLPALKSLNFAICQGPRMVDAVVALLAHLAPTLEGLRLKTDHLFSYEETRAILEAFEPHKKLRRLALPVEVFSDPTRHLVAKMLPGLQFKLVNSHYNEPDET